MKYFDLSTSIFRERQYISLLSMEIITLDLRVYVSSVYSIYLCFPCLSETIGRTACSQTVKFCKIGWFFL